MKPNEKHFSLRIDSELLRKFDAVAKYDDRSMNWLLLRLIRQCVEEFEKENGEIKFDD
ncbi:MAG: ribbon-helix-helix protein, CopG family [Clostridia bacterium]|nr:ribbon-helix-helix protein, CopG family [Clostridia bacterium]